MTGRATQAQYQMSVAFRLLRQAAEAAAVVWSGPLYPQSRDRAQRQLRQVLDDLRAFSVGLAAVDDRNQLQEFSRCLDEAWRYAEAMPAAGGELEGDFLCSAARHVIGVRKQQAQLPRTPDAGLAELLGAVQALAEIAGELAAGTDDLSARQLGSVRDSLNAAADHLRAGLRQAPFVEQARDQEGSTE